MDSIRGVLHVHSKYSFDGKLPLEELAILCRSRGYKFIALTEHAEDYGKEKMASLVAECRRLSGLDVIILPGLEYNCEGMHVLALGAESLFVETDLRRLIAKIHEDGGLAVLGHVAWYDKILYEKLGGLDGIEVWNPRYDGRLSPSLKALSVLNKFRIGKKKILAFGGLDMHEKTDFGRLSISVRAAELNREEILGAIKEGEFRTSNGLIGFDPLKDPSTHKLLIIYSIRLPYGIAKALRKAVSSILITIGVKPLKKASKIINRVF